MHVATWILVGLIAGWLARGSAGRAHWGITDVSLGLLGAVIGGTVAREIAHLSPQHLPSHAAAAALGAAILLATSRSFGRLAAPITHPKETLRDLEDHLRRLGEAERHLVGKILRRETVARDSAAAFEEQLSLGERLADRVAAFGGSWTFIFLFLAAMGVWMALNTETSEPFDPYPFILLNLVLSCLAALQAPVIMMSQNRHAAKDRLDAKNDYAVNLKAEVEVMALHSKIDELRLRHWQDLIQLQERQLALLQTIDEKLALKSGDS